MKATRKQEILEIKSKGGSCLHSAFRTCLILHCGKDRYSEFVPQVGNCKAHHGKSSHEPMSRAQEERRLIATSCVCSHDHSIH